MLPTQLNVTKARSLLPSLLHELEHHPDRIFRIVTRNRLVAELRAPARRAKGGLAAERLLSLMRRRRRGTAGVSRRISEDVDRHLY